MYYRNLALLSCIAALLLAGCGKPETDAPEAPETATAQPEPTPPPTPSLAELLASNARSDEDRARDADRNPAAVLEFLGIEPGMDVIDIMAAGGWYSEILAMAVGPDGSVTAQNPPFMLAFRDGYYDKALADRIGDRLGNVTKLDATWAELAASGGRYDAALSALNLHDAYYLQSPEAAAEMAAAIFAVLEPGGVFGVIDHAGDPDGDNANLHRIDKTLAIEVLTGAGFVVEDESDMLANPDDDHTQGVFSEGIRGKTDRFLLKLRKPAG